MYNDKICYNILSMIQLSLNKSTINKQACCLFIKSICLYFKGIIILFQWMLFFFIFSTPWNIISDMIQISWIHQQLLNNDVMYLHLKIKVIIWIHQQLLNNDVMYLHLKIKDHNYVYLYNVIRIFLILVDLRI